MIVYVFWNLRSKVCVRVRVRVRLRVRVRVSVTPASHRSPLTSEFFSAASASAPFLQAAYSGGESFHSRRARVRLSWAMPGNFSLSITW